MHIQNSLWFASQMEDFREDGDLDGSSVPPLSMRHHYDDEAPHELFHEQTKYHRSTHAGITRNIRMFLQDPGLIAKGATGFKDLSGFSEIALSKPAAIGKSLGKTMAARRSTMRADLKHNIDGQRLSTLLHHAVRVNRTARPPQAPEVIQTFRPYPSAGGLYPVELYIASSAVPPLPSAVSCYDARRHLLRPLPGVEPKAIFDAETSAGNSDAAPCALIVTAVMERSIQKYGPRGYRLALIEAGHMMQNLVLAATGLGISSLVSCSFYETEIEAALGIDGVSETVLAIIFLGDSQ